jgi:hypothetical protein
MINWTLNDVVVVCMLVGQTFLMINSGANTNQENKLSINDNILGLLWWFKSKITMLKNSKPNSEIAKMLIDHEPSYIIIELIDGTRFGAFFGPDSHVTFDRKSTFVFLQAIYTLDTKNNFIKPGKGRPAQKFINCSEIEHVRFVETSIQFPLPPAKKKH